ncbi:MAG: hypothetical protein AB1650_05500 [Candidatus Omnitrophota bacterium]
MNKLKAFPKSVAISFFLIGLFSTLSFRLIIIVQHSSPSLVRIFWYLAVLSNLIFFLFRYHISCKRKYAIQECSLIEKLRTEQPLNARDREALAYLLTSIDRSYENLNYLSIFILSAVAILVDIFISLR